MKPVITITDIESAINRCRTFAPTQDYALSKDCRLLADIYGEMIYYHQHEWPAEKLTPELQAAYDRWQGPQPE